MSQGLSSINDSTKNAFTIGAFGGAAFAIIDISLHCNGLQAGPALSLALLFLKIILLYSVVGALVMTMGGRISHKLREIQLLPFTKGSLTLFHISLFSFLSTLMIMCTITGIFHRASIAAFFWIVLSGATVGSTSWIILRFAARHHILKDVPLWKFGLLLFCLWLIITLHYWDPIRTSPLINTSLASKTRPNIVWIVLDSIRADHLSCYGYERATTPSIDRLSQESTLFLNAIAASPDCYSSNASMLTGLLPSTLGCATNEWEWVDHKFKTMAGFLGADGYETFGLSENQDHVSHQTNLDKDFEFFQVIRTIKGLDRLFLSEILNQCMLTRWGKAIGLPKFQKQLAELVLLNENESDAATIHRYSEKIINQSLSNKKPFFLFINYMGAQFPYGSSPDADHFLSGARMSFSKSRVQANTDPNTLFRLWCKKEPVNYQDRRTYNALYDGDLHFFDDQIGELAYLLRQKGIIDQTILIITSDHGEYLGEDNLFGHGHNLTNRLLHVPLIIRYPTLFKPNQQIADKISLTDILPTLLDILNIHTPKEDSIEGSSLLAYGARARSVISETFLAEPKNNYKNIQQLMTENPGLSEDQALIGALKSMYLDHYQLIASRHGDQLFDLAQDPEEQHDIRNEKPDIAIQMRRILQERSPDLDSYWGPQLELRNH